MNFYGFAPPPLVWENVINCNENKESESEIEVKDKLYIYAPTVYHIHVCNKITTTLVYYNTQMYRNNYDIILQALW